MKRYIILSLILISLLMIISVYGYETDIPTEDTAESTDISYSSDGNSLTAEYDFRKYGINVKAEYSLGEDFIQADILSENISENKNCLVCGISIMNAFGAADSSENGYFIIPDGSGAVINFNNGKINTKQYSSMVYGDDMTASSEKKAPDYKKISLPLYSIVKNDNAVLTVIRKGDANAMLNSAVSIQSSTSYNKAYFTFTVHEKDSYYIGSEENPITVCNNKKNNNDISLRYYILDDNDISSSI